MLAFDCLVNSARREVDMNHLNRIRTPPTHVDMERHHRKAAVAVAVAAVVAAVVEAVEAAEVGSSAGNGSGPRVIDRNGRSVAMDMSVAAALALAAPVMLPFVVEQQRAGHRPSTRSVSFSSGVLNRDGPAPPGPHSTQKGVGQRIEH